MKKFFSLLILVFAIAFTGLVIGCDMISLNSDTMSEEDAVNLDYVWLTIDKINFKMGENSSEVISDFTVPIKGKYGSLLTWSINPLSIAQINHANGEFKITRPQYGDATADLSINISKKGFAKTKSLSIRIVGLIILLLQLHLLQLPQL